MGLTKADIACMAGGHPILRHVARMLKPLFVRRPPLSLILSAGRRIAGLPLTTAAVQLTGTTVRDNLLDANIQFQTVLAAVKRFKPDGIGIIADVTIEAEALGCKVKYPSDGVPWVYEHPVNKPADIETLKIPDPLTAGRMPVTLQTIKLLASYFGLPVGAGGMGPFTLAGHLAGVERVMLGAKTEPEFVEKLVEFSAEVLSVYLKAQVEAGADVLIISEPTVSMLSRDHFERFFGRYVREVVGRMQRPVTLHVCGDPSHLIEDMCSTGVQCVSLDAPVDLQKIAPRVPPGVILSGNLDPVAVMVESAPDKVREAVRELMEKMRPYPNYVVSTGCDLAPDTPLENIEALIDTVKEFR